MTKRTRWLLKKVATCSCYLEKAEIARAVSFLIQDNNKLKSNIIYSIFSKLPETESLKQVKRKTLALIVDEVCIRLTSKKLNSNFNCCYFFMPISGIGLCAFREFK